MQSAPMDITDPIGKYNFISKIGRGKYGKVYRALT